MAIKQRALMKLDMTKKHVLHVMRTRSKAALGEVYRDLTEARDLYREGLPRSGYAAYGEICDGLILAVQKVMEGGEANFQEEVLALCQELLEHLERKTAKETRFKKEIFFLPYKLSMFDSLESVWRAADEDKEHCIAYVMPIPYADRNPDQTVAAWHCERDQFPKDVPTLDWQQVDLKTWHPDIVVYHSPYDDGNAVTSVDEQYYSRNLRYCADKLVYIPYFVLDEIEPGDEGAEEGIAHFILAPGVLNADLIVVQSEKMRQVYINVLSRHTNQGEEYWKAHVSGAGSPKIEKVLTSKKEDFEMPEKWRKLVEGRKVILYNTSLSAMLQNSDRVCDKLRYVFDVFRNRDDVALWWRPHPLMKAAFHSMRPQFEEEYLSLEKQYIEEGWGIYDDTSDLYRAICWSDAYYGDRSSLVWLNKASAKNILIQEYGEESRCGGNFHFQNIRYIFHENDSMWFVSADVFFIVIYEWNLKNNCLECLARLPLNETSIQTHLVLGKLGDVIVIAPFFSSEAFIEYDIVTKEFRSILIGRDLKRSTNIAAFSNAVVYGNSIFFFGGEIGCIVEYDAVQRRLIYHDIKKPVARGVDIDRHAYVLKDNYVYAVVYGTNMVLRFDLDKFQVVVHEIPHNVRLTNISYDGSDFYLLCDKGSAIVKWNIEQDEHWIISLSSGKPIVSGGCYNCIHYKNWIILLPEQGEGVQVFDKSDEVIYAVKELDGYQFTTDRCEGDRFSLVTTGRDCSFAFDAGCSTLYVFSNKNSFIKRYRPFFDKNQEKRIALGLLERKVLNVFIENHPLNLEDYLKCHSRLGKISPNTSPVGHLICMNLFD